MSMKWKTTPKSWIDPETGLEVTQLFSDEERDKLIYFTNNSFFDNGRKIVINKTVDGKLFPAILDLETYEVSQLTAPELEFVPTIVDPVKNLCYGKCGRIICSLNLKTGEKNELYHIPDGHNCGFTCGEDGEYIYGFLNEDVSGRLPPYNRAIAREQYAHNRRVFELQPHSKIFRVKFDGSKSEELLDTPIWSTHVNISPLDNNKLTFAHEGSWGLVDNRLWAIDLREGRNPEPYKLRERTEPGEGIGHEWWLRDSNWVAYQSHRKGRETIGLVNFENSCIREIDVEVFATHVHSISDRLFVLDSGFYMPYQRVVKLLDDGTVQHKVMCCHGGDWSLLDGHSTTVMAPNEKFCLFNSIRTGTTKIYKTEIPEDLSVLPDAAGFIERYKKSEK